MKNNGKVNFFHIKENAEKKLKYTSNLRKKIHFVTKPRKNVASYVNNNFVVQTL